MSTSISTQTMIAELARRVPIGYTATVAIDALNGAFRWINQQGSFPWMLRKADCTVTAVTGLFALPSGFDPGKQAVLFGSASAVVPTEIPYMPWAQAVRQQLHQTAGPGVYSCWTYYAVYTAGGSPSTTATVALQGQLFPISAAQAGTLPLVYHDVTYPALSSGASTYFPTPDHFDHLIVELAESELMRQYRIAGWDIVWKRVTDQLRALLGAYTTTKAAMMPVGELVNNAQTAQAVRAS